MIKYIIYHIFSYLHRLQETGRERSHLGNSIKNHLGRIPLLNLLWGHVTNHPIDFDPSWYNFNTCLTQKPSQKPWIFCHRTSLPKVKFWGRKTWATFLRADQVPPWCVVRSWPIWHARLRCVVLWGGTYMCFWKVWLRVRFQRSMYYSWIRFLQFHCVLASPPTYGVLEHVSHHKYINCSRKSQTCIISYIIYTRWTRPLLQWLQMMAQGAGCENICVSWCKQCLTCKITKPRSARGWSISVSLRLERMICMSAA